MQSYSVQGEQQKVLENTQITLTFDATAETLGGSGSCNSYGSEVMIKGNSFDLDSVVATEMACLDSEIMEQETRYFEILGRVTTFEMTDTKLRLDAGEDWLEFSRN